MKESSNNLIAARNLVKVFHAAQGPQLALDNINFQARRGGAAAILGPSGCGKSTLLLTLAGLEKPTQGVVLFNGAAIYRPQREIALVLQNYGLFPWKTVFNNICLGLRIRKEPIDREKIHSLMSELGIGDKSESYPQQLSGGERQRVALARALVLNPKALLLDEPFAALDTITRERLQDLLAATWRRFRFSMILVTHNIEEAVRLGARIHLMNSKGGMDSVFENPCACLEDCRASEAFIQLPRKIRERLGRTGELE
jgi:NitT/TauT family transport system ATP-binding protein